MADGTSTVTARDLRGFALSASELREMTDWPDALIEDYLNILDNLFKISEVVNEKNDFVKNVNNIDPTESPYAITTEDEEIFFETTSGDITADLPAGGEGQNYRLVNVGSGGNKVILSPNGLEKLFGDNADEYIYDQESLIITYDTAKGWN